MNDLNCRNKQLKRQSRNQRLLEKELETYYSYEGAMTPKRWREEMRGYAGCPGRKYATSFEQITRNFAKEMEKQNFIQNREWINPFLHAIIYADEGKTVQQLLDTVDAPGLKVTHATPNAVLLSRTLKEMAEERKGKTTPSIKEEDGVFSLTKSGRSWFELCGAYKGIN